MQNKRLPAMLVLAFALLSSCDQARPAVPDPERLSLPPGKWTAELTQSGGFAGVLLTVEVFSDGRLVAEDRHSGRSASKTLSPETMAELRRLITETPIPSKGTPPPICLDCFMYEFDLTSDAGITQIHSDDATIRTSGAEALIQFLGKLRDAALKP